MTITSTTAKKLKEFLGDSAPEPMELWKKPCTSCPGKDMEKCGKRTCESYTHWKKAHLIVRYKLHDLLSKPFCYAMSTFAKNWKLNGSGTCSYLAEVYYHSGMEAVERALMEMMEAK